MPRRRVNQPTQHDRYYKYLVEMMNYLAGDIYEEGYDFPPDLLAELRPDDIYRWMARKAYGIDDPGPDDHPTSGRSSSLKYYKKALSYFMPNRLQAWNSISRTGNPTRSTDVNDLIKAVKKKEVRRLGKPTSADRQLEKEEFDQAIKILESYGDFERRYLYTCIMKFQFHFIARLDDTCYVNKTALKPCYQFPFALMAQLRWSKNVEEERDAPDQILLGAMDPNYCLLLALALYLEGWIELGEGQLAEYLFGSSGSTPKRTKKRCYSAVKKYVFDSREFVRAEVEGKLGMHSVKKYGTTYPRRNGCAKDNVDVRARWKRYKRQQDDYADVTLPWPDLQITAVLCIGGPCKYVLRERCGLSDAWLVREVTPNIAAVYGNVIAGVLAKPLLWAIFDEEVSAIVPPAITARVRTAYTRVEGNRLAIAENPVEKKLLVASGNGEEVHLDEVPDMEGMARGRGQQAAETRGDQLTAVYAKQTALERRVIDMANSQQHYHHQTDRRLIQVERSVRRLSMFRPVGRRDDAAEDAEGEERRGGRAPIPFVATLSRCPRDLYILWREFEFGIGGRKPARHFTRFERGRVRVVYSKRKLVWSTIDRMVRGGYVAETAIDKIYEVYGRGLSVTEIIKRLRVDERHGGHPDLR